MLKADHRAKHRILQIACINNRDTSFGLARLPLAQCHKHHRAKHRILRIACINNRDTSFGLARLPLAQCHR